MDSPDRRADAVGRLVALLRRITRIVQAAPFVYLFFLSVYLLFESLLPEWALGLLDNIVDAPVYATACMLVFGRLLKLCSWFRAACILPFATKMENYIDAFVYTFTQNEVVLINTATGILFFAFIFITFRHFFVNGRTEKRNLRNPRLCQVQG